ncbi:MULTISPECIES: hypothetical protein [unclassified Streptomyces]|uniref:hypothetical protein n=1 Tax=unclassified Streptomyces TaxID=2593676 RepID=UPI002E30B799|nr:MULTISPECIES: hypothetical protein [unclassified Streptomyces]WUC68103.1 hypothetical protein OG861_29825 [Streptomyces sp. NBC_00539]
MRASAIRRVSTLAAGVALTLSAAVSVATPATASTVTCQAAGGDLYVTATSAPVRTAYYETGRVVDTVHRADRLHFTQSCKNSKGNLWYWVDKTYGVKDGWIYSGNVARI